MFVFRLQLCWCRKWCKCFWTGNQLLWTLLHHSMTFRWCRVPVNFPVLVLEPGLVQLQAQAIFGETPGGTNWFESTFSCIFACSLTLLWAKDVKGKEKKSWRCLITLFLWSQENKNFLFNSDYSTIVYFCFLMCYATYKVLKILAFLLGTAKEDSGKSPWMNMHLPWPIASAEISATHAAVVECLSCFTFNL